MSRDIAPQSSFIDLKSCTIGKLGRAARQILRRTSRTRAKIRSLEMRTSDFFPKWRWESTSAGHRSCPTGSSFETGQVHCFPYREFDSIGMSIRRTCVHEYRPERGQPSYGRDTRGTRTLSHARVDPNRAFHRAPRLRQRNRHPTLADAQAQLRRFERQRVPAKTE